MDNALTLFELNNLVRTVVDGTFDGCYWLKAELTTNIPYESIVDGEILKKVTPVITFRETRRYNEIEY